MVLAGHLSGPGLPLAESTGGLSRNRRMFSMLCFFFSRHPEALRQEEREGAVDENVQEKRGGVYRPVSASAGWDPGVSGVWVPVTVGKPHQGDGKPSLTRGLSLWKGRCPEVHAWPLSCQGWSRSRQPHA